MPPNVLYSSINSKILRLARNNNDHAKYIILVDKLFNRMSKQGHQKGHTKILLNEKFATHFKVELKKQFAFRVFIMSLNLFLVVC